MTTGRPSSPTTARASSMSWAVPEAGTARPISIIACLNSSRSSAVLIASAVGADQLDRPRSASAPESYSSMARLSAVWPPRVGSTASGRSLSMIFSSTSATSGST